MDESQNSFRRLAAELGRLQNLDGADRYAIRFLPEHAGLCVECVRTVEGNVVGYRLDDAEPGVICLPCLVRRCRPLGALITLGAAAGEVVRFGGIHWPRSMLDPFEGDTEV